MRPGPSESSSSSPPTICQVLSSPSSASTVTVAPKNARSVGGRAAGSITSKLSSIFCSLWIFASISRSLRLPSLYS